jgi:hypothetical protein
MNNRIKLLAEQAHCYACKYTQQPDYNPHNPYNQDIYKQRYDSKFSELIIRECSEVAGCNGHVSGFLLGDLMLSHFGFEE